MSSELVKSDLQNLSDNQIIFYIDKSWKPYFQKIISSVVARFPGVPETTDNLYWEFMALVPTLFKRLELAESEGFKTILGTKCRYFCFNKCRAWSTRKHAALNEALSLEETTVVMHDSLTTTSDTPSHVFNTGALLPIELEVYHRHFFRGETIATIARALGLTRYKVNLIYAQVVQKMRKDLMRNNL